MRIPLPGVFRRTRHRRSGRTRKLLVPILAVSLLAGLIVSLTTPQQAEAAVEDYRPATYNMQGGGGAGGSKWVTDLPRLMNAGYNVIALQEAGPEPPPSANLTWTSPLIGNAHNWTGWRVYEYTWDPFPRNINPPWHIYWVRTDFSGNRTGPFGGRVNLAFLTSVRVNSVLIARPTFWSNNGLPQGRPALGIRLGQTLFFNVHAMSSSRDGHSAGNDGPGLLTNIAAIAGARTWAAMGDWNRVPGDLRIQRGMHKYTYGGMTHTGGRELDYMVSNERIAGYGGVTHGYGSDHFAVGFRRLAANAGVQLLNAHDGNRNLTVANGLSGTAVTTGKSGANSSWYFQPAGSGLYRIVNRTSGKCMWNAANKLILWDCDDSIGSKYDIDFWSDTGQLRIKPESSTTCLGDDTVPGMGSFVLPTMNCQKGEARFNFRFDRDPGPNAPLVVF